MKEETSKIFSSSPNLFQDGREAVLQSDCYPDSKVAHGLLQEYTLFNKIKDPYIIEYL
jgi:hypothetical protein